MTIEKQREIYEKLDVISHLATDTIIKVCDLMREVREDLERKPDYLEFDKGRQKAERCK